MEKKVKDIMARVFNVDPASITEETSPHSIITWDSLTHIDLIMALQDEFKIQFEDGEIPTMISFQMILNTIKVYQE